MFKLNTGKMNYFHDLSFRKQEVQKNAVIAREMIGLIFSFKENKHHIREILKWHYILPHCFQLVKVRMVWPSGEISVEIHRQRV